MSKKSVDFHVKSNDYFGTLATILSLIIQTAGNKKRENLILGRVIKDLMYLQKEYNIIKK